MIKPICFLRFPVDWNPGKNVRDNVKMMLEYMEQQLGESYHVFILPSRTVKDVEITVYKTEESDQLDIEKLKLEIKEHFKLNTVL